MTGPQLPDAPGKRRSPDDEKASLLGAIEAYRRLYAMSEGELGALVLNALGKQVGSLKSLNESSLRELLSLLEEGVVAVDGAGAPSAPPPAPTPLTHGRSTYLAALKTVEEKKEHLS